MPLHLPLASISTQRLIITLMNRNSCFSYILLALALLLGSCERASVISTNYGIDPETEPDLLNRAMRLYGVLREGDMPEPDGSSLVINSTASAVEVSAGVRIYLPYNTNQNNEICLVYLQVQGADSHWESPVELDATSGAPFITISIPNFVQEGDFDIQYLVADCDGRVSRLVITDVAVTPPAECGTSFSGNFGITSRIIDLGDDAGTVSVNYEMYSIRDRLDLRYNERWIASTGTPLENDQQALVCAAVQDGFVSGSGSLTFQYDPDDGRSLQVYVFGCNSGTAWDIDVQCPD